MDLERKDLSGLALESAQAARYRGRLRERERERERAVVIANLSLLNLTLKNSHIS